MAHVEKMGNFTAGIMNGSGAMRGVVLLGASNVARSLATVLAGLRGCWPEPVEVLAAIGAGRSYALPSSVLGRSMVGILHCGLWDALAQRRRPLDAAVLTDVGNDLFYSAVPEQIAAWVEECLRRLEAAGAPCSMTQLPVAEIDKVPTWQLDAARRLLFPRCRLSVAELRRRALELADRLAEVAGRRGVRLVPQSRDWYGFDPVHYRAAMRGRVWEEILAPWRNGAGPLRPRGAFWRTLYLRTRTPQECILLGLRRRRAQPAVRWRDGSSLSLY